MNSIKLIAIISALLILSLFGCGETKTGPSTANLQPTILDSDTQTTTPESDDLWKNETPQKVVSNSNDNQDPENNGGNLNSADNQETSDQVTPPESKDTATVADPNADPSNAAEGPIRDPKRERNLAVIPADVEKTVNITFDDLAFDLEKGGDYKSELLTDHINALNGRTVKVKGFIKPSARSSGIKKFVFVRDDKECCFGPQAAIYDNILVALKKGKDTDYTVRPITVEGKLYLKEYQGPDGKVWSIYRMKYAQVK